MLKVTTSVIVALLITGCGASNRVISNHKLFQSVDEKDVLLVQEGKEKEYCVRCGMKLSRYYKTSHKAEVEDKKFQYCSFHCLEEHLGEGIRVKNPQVIDVAHLKYISVMDAFYVVGSKKKGTMSRVSKYAFSSLEEAKKFQRLYGGEIMDFNKTREIVVKDFKHYR